MSTPTTSTPEVTEVDSLLVTTTIEGNDATAGQNPYGKATATINHDASKKAQSSKWIVSTNIDVSILEDDDDAAAGLISAIDDILAHFTAVKTQIQALIPSA